MLYKLIYPEIHCQYRKTLELLELNPCHPEPLESGVLARPVPFARSLSIRR
jgi:hypothetical protein